MRGLRLVRAAMILAALMLANGWAHAQRRGEERRGERYTGRRGDEWLEECQRQRGGDDRERFCEVRETGSRARDRTVRVEGGTNGGVAIEGWDRDSIHIEARIQTYASSTEEAESLARDIQIITDGGTIRAEGPTSRHRTSWAVSFVVTVPFHSDVEAETENGPVAVDEVTGRMRLSAVNGPISLHSVGGDVRARAQNGPLTISLVGDRWEGTGLDAETTNGPVTLTLPERYSAELETGTVNGPMEIDFPVTVSGRIGRRISARLGAGGAPIHAVTTNGPVVVRRP